MKPLESLPILTIATALFLTGCSSPGYKKAATSSSSIQRAAETIDAGIKQMDAVLGSLSDLLNNPAANLKPQFNRFNANLNDLEGLAQDVNNKAVDMEKAGAAYFKEWDADLAKIQNEEIRARSAERRNEVAGRFERLRSRYELVRTVLTPFMSDLRDIRTALSADLTTGGLVAIKGVADKAVQDAQPLRDALSNVATGFKDMGVALSSQLPSR